MWDGLNNFAEWADQNGVPAAGAGYNSAHGTYHYMGDSGNVYHNQFGNNYEGKVDQAVYAARQEVANVNNSSRGTGLDGDALDPSTVGKNLPLFGGRSTYAGGNNPLTYNKDYTYSYVPTMLTDYPAIGHDRRYDNLEITGASGLFFDTRAIGADWRFVIEQLNIMNSSSNFVTRIDAGILGYGLGLFALPKTIYQMVKPNGYNEIMMWYHISNYGVTNKPGN